MPTTVLVASRNHVCGSRIAHRRRHFERRSRQRELFLAKAVEMAHERSKEIRDIAEQSGRPDVLHPSVALVGGAFTALESIFRTDSCHPRGESRSTKMLQSSRRLPRTYGGRNK